MFRFRLVAIIAPLIALALGSFWLFEVLRRAGDEAMPPPERKEPDFYVENFSYVKIGKTGKAQYHFSGAKMTHNPQDDSYDIVLPVINSVGKESGRGPMVVRAERGTVNNDNSQIHLYENVQLDRPATANAQAMHVRSEYMLVLPDDDVVKTDKPVKISVGQSVLTGTGMVANNATRELQLSNNVHGTYQAPQR
ncbi:LPS export ABC transporter periplasmic protein LptC [Noviherbaspirillum malthae]|uniref:LPS export ABC transporter periplasmic protein LptC n=1 Tax=Noviherbaspirillum malthae TaxID=1260987 RepID=UPI001E3D6A98|nr:LPS export ABC transporter periplasmic protein LptC [Noviherbaspirillum malthae]